MFSIVCIVMSVSNVTTSQHRKGFFGQVRSPHHAELSLLLLSIIVTIVIEILEKSKRNPREILDKSERNPTENPSENL